MLIQFEDQVKRYAVNFYDGFASKLLSDYTQGNRRTEAAIKHALGWIPPDAKRVLDIGCGIGWSTWEIGKRCSRAEIVGVDLSPKLSEIAIRLHRRERTRFMVQDVCHELPPDMGRFDAVVLLDVYEHIPTFRRAGFHNVLDRLLDESGIVIFTCPTPKHQAYLRDHKPDGLQPVDEDVTRNDIALIAEAICGRTVCYKDVSIWSENDYLHTTVARGDVRLQSGGVVAVDGREVRQARVETRLKLRITQNGLMLPRNCATTVCVATPQIDAASETFIAAHIQRLAMNVHLLHGSQLRLDEDGADIDRPGRFERLRRRICGRLRGVGRETFVRDAFVRRLRCWGVNVLLAEYGPTGVRMMPICKQADVPLVVHFHGYDAFTNDVVERNRVPYREMFEQASAIIAVSSAMREQLIALGAPAEKVVVNACGADTEQFSNANPANQPPRFLATGRFVEKKAPYLTLMAFAKARKAVPEVRLTMIGEGMLLGPCRDLANQMGVSQAVVFTGARSHAGVADQMRQSRAFVQHSIRASNGDAEGTPVAVIEAQASGLPVIATRHMGIKDVVVEDETGILVDERDVATMAEAMIKLARDPDEAARLGQAGRQRVLEHFRLEHSIHRLAETLTAAANGDGARSLQTRS